MPGVLVAVLASSACSGNGGSSATSTPDASVTARPGASSPSSTAPGAPGETAAVGRHAVGVRTETHVDPARPTSAVGTFAGAPDRTIPVTIWYPAVGDPADDPAAAAVADAAPDRRGGPYPLVLFSHGYGVTPEDYAALLARWAAAGYVVVAPTYPLLSGVPAGPSHEDYGQVFADESFVLDRVLAETGSAGSAGSAHPLAGLVDPTRVAAAGQSDGEVAAFGSGFLECCRDRRVRAVIAMAGNLGNVNNPVERDNGVPVMHLMGAADELQPVADAVAWDREHLSPPRWIVTLVGGTHLAPYRDPADPRFPVVVDLTTAFLDGTLRAQPARLAAIDGIVAGGGDLVRLER